MDPTSSLSRGALSVCVLEEASGAPDSGRAHSLQYFESEEFRVLQWEQIICVSVSLHIRQKVDTLTAAAAEVRV
jgi:hypothetical protein